MFQEYFYYFCNQELDIAVGYGKKHSPDFLFYKTYPKLFTLMFNSCFDQGCRQLLVHRRDFG